MGEIIGIILLVMFTFGIGFVIGSDNQATKACNAKGGIPVGIRCFKPDSELK